MSSPVRADRIQNVGQVGNLPPIANRRNLRGLTTRCRMTSCPTF